MGETRLSKGIITAVAWRAKNKFRYLRASDPPPGKLLKPNRNMNQSELNSRGNN